MSEPAVPGWDARARPGLASGTPTPRALLLARSAFVVAGLSGGMVLLAWLVQPAAFPFRMKANTSLCIVLLARALYADAGRPRDRPVERTLAAVVALIAALTLSQDVLGWDAHLDELLAHDLRAGVHHPGRMAPATAISLLLLAVRAFLGPGPRPTSALAPLCALLVSTFALTGYLYGVREFYAIGDFVPIAPGTAIAFVLLALGALLCRPTSALVTVLIGEPPGGAPLRRLLAGLVALPLLLGLVTLVLRKQEIFDEPFGLALVTTATVFLLLALASFTTRSLLLARSAREQLERELAHREAELQASARTREAEQALARSEEKYRTLAVHAPVGIFEALPDRSCIFVNHRWTEITGISFEQALGRGWQGGIHPDDLERVTHAWNEAEEHGTASAVDFRFVRPDGKIAWVEARAIPMKSPDGATLSYLGTIVDVTERTRALDSLARSEAGFRLFVERAPVGAIVFREDRVVYANSAYARMLGYDDPAELIGRSVMEAIVHPSARALSEQRLAQIEAGEPIGTALTPVLRRDGSTLILEGASAPIVFDGAPALGSIARDVTEQQRIEEARLAAERTLRESLAEKEVLLKEIHHRVKNNLQVIVSLLNLQCAQLEDRATRTVLEEMRSRVHAIALLHERLYRSKNLGRIDMRDYLKQLAIDLRSTNSRAQAIALSVSADELYLGMDAAVPIGLIVNELVTNAYKHAFPPGSPARAQIDVRLTCEQDDVELSVRDSGVGLAAPMDIEHADSLGMLLISSLARQLEGTLAFASSERGVACTVRFPTPS